MVDACLPALICCITSTTPPSLTDNMPCRLVPFRIGLPAHPAPHTSCAASAPATHTHTCPTCAYTHTTSRCPPYVPPSLSLCPPLMGLPHPPPVHRFREEALHNPRGLDPWRFKASMHAAHYAAATNNAPALRMVVRELGAQVGGGEAAPGCLGRRAVRLVRIGIPRMRVSSHDACPLTSVVYLHM